MRLAEGRLVVLEGAALLKQVTSKVCGLGLVLEGVCKGEFDAILLMVRASTVQSRNVERIIQALNRCITAATKELNEFNRYLLH